MGQDIAIPPGKRQYKIFDLSRQRRFRGLSGARRSLARPPRSRNAYLKKCEVKTRSNVSCSAPNSSVAVSYRLGLCIIVILCLWYNFGYNKVHAMAYLLVFCSYKSSLLFRIRYDDEIDVFLAVPLSGATVTHEVPCVVEAQGNVTIMIGGIWNFRSCTQRTRSTPCLEVHPLFNFLIGGWGASHCSSVRI